MLQQVKEVEPEEVQGRIIVACGWLVQGNFRAGAAARVPEQAPRHWRSVGRILETKVRLYLVRWVFIGRRNHTWPI